MYDLEYYEFSCEHIPNTLVFCDIANDHCFFIKAGLDVNKLVTIGELPQKFSERFAELMNHPFSIENIISGGKYKTFDMDDYGNDKIFIRNSAYELNIAIKFYEHSANELILPTNYLINSVPYEKANVIKKNVGSNEILPGIKLDMHLVNHSKTQISTKSEYIKVSKLTESFTVIDFETTGLSITDSEIIQIGAVKYSVGKIVDNFSSYVKPTSSFISPTITKITGITNDMLSEAPTIEKILPSFLDYIKRQTLVTHNASFDMKFLLSSIEKCNIDIERFRVIDTLPLSRRLIEGMPNYKLETLKKQLSLGDRKSHNALEDCYTAGSLYMTCFQRSKSN